LLIFSEQPSENIVWGIRSSTNSVVQSVINDLQQDWGTLIFLVSIVSREMTPISLIWPLSLRTLLLNLELAQSKGLELPQQWNSCWTWSQSMAALSWEVSYFFITNLWMTLFTTSLWSICWVYISALTATWQTSVKLNRIRNKDWRHLLSDMIQMNPASRMKIVARGGVMETAISVAFEWKLTWSVHRSKQENLKQKNCHCNYRQYYCI